MLQPPKMSQAKKPAAKKATAAPKKAAVKAVAAPAKAVKSGGKGRTSFEKSG